MSDEATVEAPTAAETPVVEMPTESRMHRFRVGDRLSFRDSSVWPEVDMEGVLDSFTNVEGTYILVKFDDGSERELTEDEVTRIG